MEMAGNVNMNLKCRHDWRKLPWQLPYPSNFLVHPAVFLSNM